MCKQLDCLVLNTDRLVVLFCFIFICHYYDDCYKTKTGHLLAA